MHCYQYVDDARPEVVRLLTINSHPDRVRTIHEWIDWFVEFEQNPDRTYGLEFVEGIWAEKLGILAIAVNIATIAVSIVWVIKGGNLQTVFTVMSFIITAVAADIALLALYYQVGLVHNHGVLNNLSLTFLRSLLQPDLVSDIQSMLLYCSCLLYHLSHINNGYTYSDKPSYASDDSA